MKKCLVVILLVLYAASSSGATIRVRYCMGKLQSIGLTFQQEESQLRAGIGKVRKLCCDDLYKTILSQRDYCPRATHIRFFEPAPAELPSAGFSVPVLSVSRECTLVSIDDPPARPLPVFLRNRNLRL
jgi:hypothetical protein